jgi:hypothetical protein
MKMEEHFLMVMMLTKQAQLINTLFQILESRDIISSDDRKAYGQLVRGDVAASAELLRQWQTNYVAAAKHIGVTTGLED